jgi:TonB family protein
MPDSLSLGLLPERNRDWRTFAASYGVELLLILFLLGLRLIFPDRLPLHPMQVTELIPASARQPKPLKAQRRRHVAVKPLAPLSTPKLVVPREVIAQARKLPEPPKMVAEFKPPQLQPARALPPKPVYTGSFGSSALATAAPTAQKVQTGGFGDPNGLPGPGKNNSFLPAAKLGSFDLPPGAGQGNGANGRNGIKATVVRADFGSGIADGHGRSNPSIVQSAGFGAQEISRDLKPVHNDDGPPTTPVQIISKPNPAYTQEARQLKLEGEVLLEVMFGANGQLRVNRVVRGLGHGLDEEAVAVANKIQFKPASRNGSPVDSTSIVHVIFQLAY